MNRPGIVGIAAAAIFATLAIAPAPASAFGVSAMNGNYALSLARYGTCSDIRATVALFKFDGRGHLSGNATTYESNSDGSGTAAVNTMTITGGTYSVSQDGSGSLRFTTGRTHTMSFVIDNIVMSVARHAEILQTDLTNNDSCARLGTLTHQ